MNLQFSPVPNPGKKTCRWVICNTSGEHLGYIEYRPTWRKYVWGMLHGSIFDISCTQEVIDFLNLHKDDRQ